MLIFIVVDKHNLQKLNKTETLKGELRLHQHIKIIGAGADIAQNLELHFQCARYILCGVFVFSTLSLLIFKFQTIFG